MRDAIRKREREGDGRTDGRRERERESVCVCVYAVEDERARSTNERKEEVLAKAVGFVDYHDSAAHPHIQQRDREEEALP